MGDSVATTALRSPTGQMFPPTIAAAKLVAELHRKKGKGTGQRTTQEWAGEQRTVRAGEQRTKQERTGEQRTVWASERRTIQKRAGEQRTGREEQTTAQAGTTVQEQTAAQEQTTAQKHTTAQCIERQKPQADISVFIDDISISRFWLMSLLRIY